MKVLLITYAYAKTPMHIFTGSQRSFSFTKYMIRQGHNIVVLSHNHDSKPSLDIGEFGEKVYRFPDFISFGEKCFLKFLSLLSKKNSTSIFSTNTMFTKKANKFHKKFFYIPDRQIVWAIRASFAAFDLLRGNHFDVILTTSPSESAHIVGWALKRFKKIPWIADLRDGWMYEPFLEVRKHDGLRKRLESALERSILTQADSVTTVTQPILNDLNERLNVAGNKTFLVPNGFDAEDFEISEESLASAHRTLGKTNSKMLIVHMGRLSDARKDCDIFPFFKALRKFKLLKPDLAQELSVHIVGSDDCPEIGLSEKMGLKDIVHFYPMIPKPDAIAMIKTADVLLLITSPSQKSIATSKVFDYMAVGKPVLALAEGNVASQIVNRTGIGLTVSPEDITAIFEKLRTFFDCWKNNSYPFKPEKKRISEYRRENQVKMMSKILERSAAMKTCMVDIIE